MQYKRSFAYSLTPLSLIFADNKEWDVLTSHNGIAPKMRTILIVDDTMANLELLQDLLEREGYATQTALNGRVALKLIAQQKPDLILLDVMMPDLSGFEVCQLLQKNPDTQALPIVFISALSDTESIVKGFELGGADYITKPFRSAEVLARVRNQVSLIDQRESLAKSFQDLNKMRTQFIHNATHDLKNPLHIIQSYSQILADALVKDAELSQYVQRILASSERMWALVRDMLDLGKLESGESLNLVEAPVNQFLQRCQYEFEMTAQQRGIELKVTPLEEDLILLLDISAMMRIFENLVSNAIKYTPSGGRVELRASRSASRLYIFVSDSGVGISSQDLPHIFEPFYRVNTRQIQEVEGTGLGLTIVKHLVAQHQGDIRVESNEGQGTLFTISLPIQLL